jgi:hypothetical protein
MTEQSDAYKRRVTPSQDRPKLKPELEEQLAPVDEKNAKAYDKVEEAAEKIGTLIDALRDGAVVAELEVTDSLVHLLTEADRKA